MHYRNGREAKNGDTIVQLSTEGGRVMGVGILYDAVLTSIHAASPAASSRTTHLRVLAHRVPAER